MIVPGQAEAKNDVIVFDHSSWLAYADYNPLDLSLEVGFKDGRIQEFSPIYPQTILDWKAAPSKGSYFNQAIRRLTEPTDVKK